MKITNIFHKKKYIYETEIDFTSAASQSPFHHIGIQFKLLTESKTSHAFSNGAYMMPFSIQKYAL